MRKCLWRWIHRAPEKQPMFQPQMSSRGGSLSELSLASQGFYLFMFNLREENSRGPHDTTRTFPLLLIKRIFIIPFDYSSEDSMEPPIFETNRKKKPFEQHTLQCPFSVGFGGKVGLFGLQYLCGSQPALMIWLNFCSPPPPLAGFKGCCGDELIFSSWVAITMSVAVSLILLSLLLPSNNEDYYWCLALLRGAWQLREHCNLW